MVSSALPITSVLGPLTSHHPCFAVQPFSGFSFSISSLLLLCWFLAFLPPADHPFFSSYFISLLSHFFAEFLPSTVFPQPFLPAFFLSAFSRPTDFFPPSVLHFLILIIFYLVYPVPSKLFCPFLIFFVSFLYKCAVRLTLTRDKCLVSLMCKKKGFVLERSELHYFDTKVYANVYKQIIFYEKVWVIKCFSAAKCPLCLWCMAQLVAFKKRRL